ncbi:hypothetical protein NP233_g956 [Leucocoprinus birnbaumii]|uniref:Uncharacterized protein n=1 Tax=Leucocoprinus birnbaumii TaxID=56174 RepID=A0AAD5W1B0_9AGAR|nr:hypothetical protein NP233_g956 [Leucocoprinus birnbaumii]
MFENEYVQNEHKKRPSIQRVLNRNAKRSPRLLNYAAKRDHHHLPKFDTRPSAANNQTVDHQKHPRDIKHPSNSKPDEAEPKKQSQKHFHPRSQASFASFPSSPMAYKRSESTQTHQASKQDGHPKLETIKHFSFLHSPCPDSDSDSSAA